MLVNFPRAANIGNRKPGRHGTHHLPDEKKNLQLDLWTVGHTTRKREIDKNGWRRVYIFSERPTFFFLLWKCGNFAPGAGIKCPLKSDDTHTKNVLVNKRKNQSERHLALVLQRAGK